MIGHIINLTVNKTGIQTMKTHTQNVSDVMSHVKTMGEQGKQDFIFDLLTYFTSPDTIELVIKHIKDQPVDCSCALSEYVTTLFAASDRGNIHWTWVTNANLMSSSDYDDTTLPSHITFDRRTLWFHRKL